MRPSLHVVENDEPAEIAFDLLVDAVECPQLIPYAAGRVRQRHIDSVVIVSADVPLRVDAVAGYDQSAALRFQDHELLADRMAFPEPQMQAWQQVIQVAIDKVQPMLERGIEGISQIVRIDDLGEVANCRGMASASIQDRSSRFWIWIRAWGNWWIEPI
mgnify:FL=1